MSSGEEKTVRRWAPYYKTWFPRTKLFTTVADLIRDEFSYMDDTIRESAKSLDISESEIRLALWRHNRKKNGWRAVRVKVSTEAKGG